MLGQLPADELADVSGPDDQRVLDVGGMPASEDACQPASADHPEERK
jgi:hypothetical protein